MTHKVRCPASPIFPDPRSKSHAIPRRTDSGLVLPYITMQSLIEMVKALDVVTPGMASEHTLFYGVEAKFYSARPELTANLETKVDGLFCGDDRAGVTRGLAQAGASGVLMARSLWFVSIYTLGGYNDKTRGYR